MLPKWCDMVSRMADDVVEMLHLICTTLEAYNFVWDIIELAHKSVTNWLTYLKEIGMCLNDFDLPLRTCIDLFFS